VRLCEAYKQQYQSLRDAMKQDNPEKVGARRSRRLVEL
jgi:hypothetical protein